jgi:ATP-dependent phosphofructokinase / diphosphate-dependent phosphofructokinase
MAEKRKINQFAILVGGGPAPGINSVIHAVTEEANRNHCPVIGIYDGFKNLLQGKLVGIPLTRQVVGDIYMNGGSILHSARANPAKSPERLRTCVNTLHAAGIDALVSIGGDDTAYSASQVSRFAQEEMGIDLRSVHVPKTIDNDLPLPDNIPTFGFETARDVGARLVMNLKRDSLTMQHWFLVLSMGRNSGHLALGIGQAATATITLIPEEWSGREIRLREVVDTLVTTMLLRLAEGKPYGVAVLAEGILEQLSIEDLQMLAHIERDEHGHIRLPDINFLDILKVEIDRELASFGIQLKIVKHILGYELRCAPPCALDIEYTRGLGTAAVEFLLNGGTNAIITLQHGQVVPIPYAEMINPLTGRTAVRMVDRSSYSYCTAYRFMTRLKPEHALDADLFAKLSAVTGKPAQELLDRYAYLMG